MLEEDEKYFKKKRNNNKLYYAIAILIGFIPFIALVFFN